MKRFNDHGQIIVEYILLLIIAVSIAMLITSTMISRNPDSPGFLIQKWDQIIRLIGEDPVDTVVPPEGNSGG